MASTDYIKYKIGFALRAQRTDTPKPLFYKKALRAIPKIKPHVIDLLNLHIPKKGLYRYKVNPPFKYPIKAYHVELMKASASLFRCYLTSRMELNDYNEATRVYYFVGNCHYTRMAYKLFKYSAFAIERSLKDTSKVYLAKNKLIRDEIRRKGKSKKTIVDLISLTRAIKSIEVNNIITEILSLTLATENTYINPDYYPSLNKYIIEQFRLVPRKSKYFERVNSTGQDYKSITKYYGKKPLQILNYDPTRLTIKIEELRRTINSGSGSILGKTSRG